MLHLITCHGRIMPRLAELLFFSETDFLIIRVPASVFIFLPIRTKRKSTVVVFFVFLLKLCLLLLLPMPHKNFLTGSVGVVGWCEGAVYLTSPGCPADIGLQLGKACYPCSG